MIEAHRSLMEVSSPSNTSVEAVTPSTLLELLGHAKDRWWPKSPEKKIKNMVVVRITLLMLI
jgi:hypothetical protein